MYARGDTTDGAVARHDIALEGIPLGTVTVVLDTARIDHLRAWTHGLAAAVLAIWLCVAIYSVQFARATVKPIRAMMEFSRAVAGGDFTHHLDVQASAELDELRDYLNAMTRDLATRERERSEMQKELLSASRLAGMAEVATGVLHNVGNVLNSLNVGASVVADRLRDPRATALGKAVALYAGHPGGLAAFLATDKGKLLPDYLAKIAAAQSEDNARLRAEIAAVIEHVGHIRTIVATQQSVRAGGRRPARTRRADGVVDEALRIAEASFARHQIEVVRDYGELPPVVTDRHKLLQIVVNLVSNARDAMRDAHRAGREEPMRLTARVSTTRTGRVQIAIADTGVGIAPDDPRSHVPARLHDQEGRPRLRPPHQRERRARARRRPPRRERRPRPRRDLHGVTAPRTGEPACPRRLTTRAS